MKRQRCVFTGNVQGVGFRATARDLAGRFVVTGYVRNVPNGSVEIVVEGEPDEIARFVAEVGRNLGQFIRATHCFDETSAGEYEDFAIAR